MPMNNNLNVAELRKAIFLFKKQGYRKRWTGFETAIT